MKKVKKLIFFLLCLFVTINIHAQNNPFDVKSRLAELPIDSIDQDSSAKPTNALDLNTAIPSSSNENFQKLKAKNPFEVNHIPLIGKSVPSIGQIKLDIKPKVSNSFTFWIMFFAWALLALALSTKHGIVMKLTRSVFNENVLKLTKRQDGEKMSIQFAIMYLVFFINLAVFIYLIVRHFTKHTGTLTWFYILVGVVIVYLVRHTVLALLSWLFPIEKELGLYSFTIMIINLLLGVLLIIPNLLMAYGPENIFKGAMYFGVILFGLCLFLRFTRGFFISANYIFGNIFLFFVYLCAIEIAPILVGYRIISNYIH